MGFITNLTPYDEIYGIYTGNDKLTKLIERIPIRMVEGALSTPEVEELFFIACSFDIPWVILHDHDTSFIVGF